MPTSPLAGCRLFNKRWRYQHPLQADGWAGMMLVAAFVAAIIALLVAGVGGFTGCYDERKLLWLER
jgi:hypothetical protein